MHCSITSRAIARWFRYYLLRNTYYSWLILTTCYLVHDRAGLVTGLATAYC